MKAKNINEIQRVREILDKITEESSYSFSISKTCMISSIQSGYCVIFKKGVYPPDHKDKNSEESIVGYGETLEQAVLSVSDKVITEINKDTRTAEKLSNVGTVHVPLKKNFLSRFKK